MIQKDFSYGKGLLQIKNKFRNSAGDGANIWSTRESQSKEATHYTLLFLARKAI